MSKNLFQSKKPHTPILGQSLKHSQRPKFQYLNLENGGGAGLVRGNGREIAWRCLDAQFWGVPQRRKRIFLVADFGGERAGEILFEREGLSGDTQESREAWEEVATCAGNSIEATSPIGFAMQAIGEYRESDRSSTLKQRDYKDATDLVCEPLILENHPADSRVKIDETGTTQTLTSRMGTGGGNVPMLMQPIAFNGRQNPVSGEIAGTLDTGHPQAQCVAYPDPAKLLVKGNFSYRLDQDNVAVQAVDVRNLRETEELSGTLQAKENGGYSLNYQNPVRIGYRVRRLTPVECLRLQGFPDWWLDIEGASDSAKYKAIGNSIANPPLEFIFQRLVEVFK